MTESQIGVLLTGAWAELRQPAILWQLGVLAVAVGVAWWISRLLQWRAPEGSLEAVKRGAAALRRVAFPLLAVLFIAVGRVALSPWQSAMMLRVAIALFGALAAIRALIYLLRIAFAHAAWLDAFERSIATVVWAVLALHLTGLLPEIIAWLSDTELALGKYKVSLWALVTGAFWIGVTLLVSLWISSALEARLMRAEHLHSSLRVVVARVVKAVLLVATVLVILPLMGFDVTVLSVFGGALGVGLGLGLQKIASNYVSGFIILLDRSIRLGDMVTVDNQYGEVTRITTRYTVIRSLTGIESIIPNDTLVTTTVVNHSYTDKRIRIAVRVQVDYCTDVKEAFRLMLEVAKAQPRVLKEPEPTAQVLQLGDSGIDLELGVWIDDPEHGSQNLRSDLIVALLARFRERGVEIPYPRRDIRVLQGSTATVPGRGRES
jgi:small-conductance mechanosensitive channel